MKPINEQILDAVLEMVGWPHRHAGRNKYGVDCVGVVILAAHKCGITTYDTVNYSQRPNVENILREMKNHLKQIGRQEELKSGDVLMFSIRGHPCHLSVLDMQSKIPYIIHSTERSGKVIREPLCNLAKSIHHIKTFRYAGM